LAIESDLNYNYKFQERTALQSLLKKAESAGFDDALIVKNGLITDTTIANIAFFDGTRWLTPALPLLQGTARARLLRSGLITPKQIAPEELEQFSHFALMNALSGFYIGGGIENIER
jgi:4-amino-4-deoxychorismate lyase